MRMLLLGALITVDTGESRDLVMVVIFLPASFCFGDDLKGVCLR